MKKILKLVIFAFVMLAACCFSAYAKDNIKLYIDGKLIKTDVAPEIVNNRTLVPVRSVFEELGAEVTWISSRKQVIIRSVTTRIVFNLGKSKAYVDDKGYELDVAATAIDGRTMIPVRFVSEKLGYDVEWSSQANAVHINTPNSKILGSVITNVNVSKYSKNTKVTITADDLKKPEISYASNPMRFIADFTDGKLENGDSYISVNNKDITQVRFAQHPDFARVVIEAPTDAKFTVKYTSGKMIITVEGVEAPVVKPPASESVTPPVTENPPKEETEPVKPSVPQIPEVNVPKGEPLIVLDAGHGGDDVGAVGTDSEGNIVLKESHANLAIALAAQKYLEAADVNVLMTRTEDVGLGTGENDDLYTRVQIANTVGATYFVSIHNNSFISEAATGTEILYIESGTPNEYGVSSKILAENILGPIVKATGLANRGLKDSPNIYVIKHTNMPAVLIECAFVSNPKDRSVLMDEAKIDEMGYAIASGIIKVLDEYK